jgi:uncharacterized protein (DUF2252 family)
MTTSDGARTGRILEVFEAAFGELAAGEPAAFRRKFRKMAASPFAFYRGSACLFYADMAGVDDPFLDQRTSRVWIHGDLHCENFGTYMSSDGFLVFNVNDFDEAYVGPFTWDVRRLAASLALLGHAKAVSDAFISELVTACVGAYVAELRTLVERPDEASPLTLETTTGSLHDVLQRARLRTRVALLDGLSLIERYDRRFKALDGVSRVDEGTGARVVEAFGRYVGTLPPDARTRPLALKVKDVVARRGVGIGSAGLLSYNILVEGHTQALENDVVLFMKQGQVPAVSAVIDDPGVRGYFLHQGHRTAVSQKALQAHADPWLGYTDIDGVGQLVAEVSPYAADLDWDDVNEPADLLEVVRGLGRAAGRMHSVADDESDHDLVDFSTEAAILAAVSADERSFTDMLVEFAHDYGARVRADHDLFVDLFRNGKIIGLE